MIAVPEVLFLGLILGIILLAFGFIIFIMMIKKQAPGMMTIMKAFRKDLPLAFIFYPEGTIRPFIPEIKKGNPDTSSNYYTVGNTGIKFRNPDGSKIHRWMGKIPVYCYFRDTPEPIAMSDAVAFSQLKDYFKSAGHDLSNMEDIAFYVLSEVERTHNVQQALKNAKIDNQETIEKLLQFLSYVKENKEMIEKEKLKSGIFTYQTAIRSLDSVMAYTSANVAHMKAVLEAAIRRNIETGAQELLKWGILVFLCCLGVGTLFMLIGGN